MDPEVTDATIAKLNAKPPLWIRRRMVINEIDDKTAHWVALLFSAPSREFIYEDFRNNRNDYNDSYLSQSPFWNYRMFHRSRHDFWRTRGNSYNDINDKIRYDYMIAINQAQELPISIDRVQELPFNIEMSANEIEKQEYGPRQIMWREAQRETLFGLYGKISDDMVTEIISFC